LKQRECLEHALVPLVAALFAGVAAAVIQLAFRSEWARVYGCSFLSHRSDRRPSCGDMTFADAGNGSAIETTGEEEGVLGDVAAAEDAVIILVIAEGADEAGS